MADDWSKKREAAISKIDKSASDLNAISQDIWSNPELNYNEHHAHKVLTDYLEKEGFEVTRKYHLETAFKATYGSDDGVHVCVMCEYDALPNIGHACGHNLIAECGAGAGLGLKAALALDDKPVGRVTVLGTPAEEGGGGKIKLIEAGALNGIDVAMMAHPYAQNILKPSLLAMAEIRITYTGLAAHASLSPWIGVNALDAAVQCYSSISSMRQQLKPEWRVHGIITKGGAQPNIIPEEAELLYYYRASTVKDLDFIRQKLDGCAKGAATQTGCQVEIKEEGSFANVVSNPTLASIYEKHATDLGVEFAKLGGSGSTDMGNVSQVVPSIHPMYDIVTKEPNHSRAFTKATGAAEAQAPTLVQAKAMALTCLELLQAGNGPLLDTIQQEFKAQMAELN